jgi:hypothetical protein
MILEPLDVNVGDEWPQKENSDKRAKNAALTMAKADFRFNNLRIFMRNAHILRLLLITLSCSQR